MEPVEISNFVKNVRKTLNLTQERFARAVGVSFATINSWENNKRRPQPYLMARLHVLEKKSRKVQETRRAATKHQTLIKVVTK